MFHGLLMLDGGALHFLRMLLIGHLLLALHLGHGLLVFKTGLHDAELSLFLLGLRLDLCRLKLDLLIRRRLRRWLGGHDLL
ncbi:hypothetical protein PMI03_03463 [Rhizobium sp. AP16]|nr:hypothetical protein PMI03_03463 [Rhizobium sp. AP16]